MRKAGGIGALIAGVFGIFAAGATLLVGGVGASSPPQPTKEQGAGFHLTVPQDFRLLARDQLAQQLLSQYRLLAATPRGAKTGSGVSAGLARLSTTQAKLSADVVSRAAGAIAAAMSKGDKARRQLELQKASEGAPPSRTVVGLIIKYRDPAFAARSRANDRLSETELEQVAAVVGVSLAGSRAMSGDAFVVTFSEPVDMLTALRMVQKLEAEPWIEHASPDALVQPQMLPNDPRFSEQWALQEPLAGIDAPHAWDITTGSPNTVVAVIDTGILPHPEFASRLLPGYDLISDPGSSGDGEGRDPDPTDAGNWVSLGYCGPGSAAQNSSWHGTHVTGIIAATGNNSIGIAGLDWHTSILPVRVIGKCSAATSDTIDSMNWAAGLSVPGVPANPTPARVINMSLGGPQPCRQNPAEQLAALQILLQGTALVVSAGNENDEAANHSPAGCYGVLTIGATGPNGDRAYYSNFSQIKLDLSAPGGNQRDFGTAGGILSTLASGTQSDRGSPVYGYYQGTSQAAPQVAGTVALMLAANPSLTIAQIHDILVGTAKPFASGTSCATQGNCGSGILNAGKAVEDAQSFIGFKWNFSDHWFNPPEDGWGIQVVAQGELVFVTWYTYGSDGLPLWFTMQLTRAAQDIFKGDVYYTRGVPLSEINGQPATTSIQKVGTAVLMFFEFNEAWLYYNINGIEAAKHIKRLSFASPTFCYYTSDSRASATNFQDLWWNPSESGWGINLTHQGDVIFATWFTYGAQGQPLWLYMVAQKQGPNTYAGRFIGTTGVPFDRIDGAPSVQQYQDVGSGTLTFESGERARFDYKVFGISGSKTIERQVFSSPVTTCQPLQ